MRLFLPVDRVGAQGADDVPASNFAFRRRFFETLTFATDAPASSMHPIVAYIERSRDSCLIRSRACLPRAASTCYRTARSLNSPELRSVRAACTAPRTTHGVQRQSSRLTAHAFSIRAPSREGSRPSQSRTGSIAVSLRVSRLPHQLDPAVRAIARRQSALIVSGLGPLAYTPCRAGTALAAVAMEQRGFSVRRLTDLVGCTAAAVPTQSPAERRVHRNPVSSRIAPLPTPSQTHSPSFYRASQPHCSSNL